MASNNAYFRLVLLPTLAFGFTQLSSLPHSIKTRFDESRSLNFPRISRANSLVRVKAVFLGENEQKEVGSIKMPISLQEERLEADRVLSRATEDGKLSLKELEQLQQQEAAELQLLLEKVRLMLFF